MEKLLDSVWEYAKNSPYGFTLNISTMKPVKFGICVAYFETQDSYGKDGLRKALEHALKHNKIVGGWLNDDNDYYYFDSIRLFTNLELKEAIEFAKRNKQLAIFDLTNLKEIRIGEGE